MDGMDFVERLAAKARDIQDTPADLTARIMQSVRQQAPAVDLTPVVWFAGTVAAIATVALLVSLLCGGSADVDASSIYDVLLSS